MKKLNLKKDVIRNLNSNQLQNYEGGATPTVVYSVVTVSGTVGVIETGGKFIEGMVSAEQAKGGFYRIGQGVVKAAKYLDRITGDLLMNKWPRLW